MAFKEKNISYLTQNTYATLNELTPKTTYVWVIFHGIGFLSRYFLKYFDGLDPEKNYIIAPQAPSKYYLNGQYKHVGASWLTKEHTATEINNLMSYLDSVMANEDLPDTCRLVVFGYSQGVSIAMRWVAQRNIQCDHLVLYAGGIPNELTKDQLRHLGDHCKLKIIMGDRDEYLTEERMEQEQKKIDLLFEGRAQIQLFDGGHEIKKEIINNLP
ncbi:esterase [uncultured Muriicola sp.]|uniref:alpha/beta hydrolase n=1 Tax=uncultured Muriicola sp. TaxID=1583102 RepID=UPI00262EDC40|nr:esterase [uncultured Muriicola sp.]